MAKKSQPKQPAPAPDEPGAVQPGEENEAPKAPAASPSQTEPPQVADSGDEVAEPVKAAVPVADYYRPSEEDVLKMQAKQLQIATAARIETLVRRHPEVANLVKENKALRAKLEALKAE